MLFNYCNYKKQFFSKKKKKTTRSNSIVMEEVGQFKCDVSWAKPKTITRRNQEAILLLQLMKAIRRIIVLCS